jgi:hypothetical protein
MIWTNWTTKRMLVAAMLTPALAISFFTIASMRPQPYVSSVLTEWQCTRTAGVVTVCTKKPG